MDKFHIFLYFPENLGDISENNFDELIKQTIWKLDLADCQTGCDIYFHQENLMKFKNELDIASELYKFGGYFKGLYQSLIKSINKFTDCNELSLLKKTSACVYAIQTTRFTPSSPSNNSLIQLIQEAGCYQFEMGGISLLLDFQKNFQRFNRSFYAVLKDSCLINDGSLPTITSVRFLQGELKDLHQWFKEKTTPRKFNKDDERHDERSPKFKGDSPLLRIRENTKDIEKIQDLLDSAITDQREKENVSKKLVAYDEERERYIRFETEGDNPQNQYHAYHLAKKKSHERDSSSRGEGWIPPRIKLLLRLLQNAPDD